MKVGLDRRRNPIRTSSSSEETDQTSITQRVNTIVAVMTALETVPVDDAVSLGSVDSLSSIDNEASAHAAIGGKDIGMSEDQYSSKQKLELDVQIYMEAREMTATQEKWNAITILPNPLYCIYYIVYGNWVSGKYALDVTVDQNFDHSKCLTTPWLPHALPPWPVACIALAICLHAPASFLYHWVYAHSLPPVARISHWSRRLDHVFIHVASALCAYGTSGSWDYFLANVMFNGDCIYRQFLKKVRPRHNQMRIFFSILAYTMPILKRGDVLMFGKCWVIVLISGWLFAQYPLKGWSHAMFHLVIALLPPLLLQVAIELPASKEQITMAVQCATSNGGGLKQ